MISGLVLKYRNGLRLLYRRSYGQAHDPAIGFPLTKALWPTPTPKPDLRARLQPRGGSIPRDRRLSSCRKEGTLVNFRPFRGGAVVPSALVRGERLEQADRHRRERLVWSEGDPPARHQHWRRFYRRRGEDRDAGCPAGHDSDEDPSAPAGNSCAAMVPFRKHFH
jgi:hypothetical protein